MYKYYNQKQVGKSLNFTHHNWLTDIKISNWTVVLFFQLIHGSASCLEILGLYFSQMELDVWELH